MWPSNWGFGIFNEKASLQKRLVKFLLQRTIGNFVKNNLDWDKDLDVQISSESYFTDGGQSILDSSVYIADDFLKAELFNKNPKSTTGIQSPIPDTGEEIKDRIEDDSKLDFFSDVIDKIIFGTDIFINNAKFNFNFSPRNESISHNSNKSSDSLLSSFILEFSKLSLTSYRHPVSENANTLPSSKNFNFGETKYKYVNFGKIEKCISLDNFRILLKHHSKDYALISILDSQPQATFTLFHKLKVSRLEPIYLNDHSSELGIYNEDEFSVPMPGEFRDIQYENTKNSNNASGTSLNHNTPNHNENDDKLDNSNQDFAEGWEIDLKIGTIAILLIPDIIDDLLYFSDIISNWLHIKSKTDEIIKNFQSNQFAFNSSSTPAPEISFKPQSPTSSVAKNLFSVSISKTIFCLISPDADYINQNLINSKKESLYTWDSNTSFDSLMKFLISFKHLRLVISEFNIKIDFTPQTLAQEALEVLTSPNSSHELTETPPFLKFSASKLDIIEYDFLQEIRDFDILKLNKTLFSNGSSLDNFDIKGWFSHEFKSGRVDISPIQLDISLKMLDRFEPYKNINLSSQTKSKSSSLNKISNKNRIGALKTHKHGYAKQNFEGSLHTDNCDEDSDFITKNNSDTFIQINDYINSESISRSKKIRIPNENSAPIEITTSKSEVFLSSKLIRLCITLPSIHDDTDQNNEYMNRLKNMEIYDFLIINENAPKKHDSSKSSDKVLIVDWLDVQIYKTNRTNISNESLSKDISKTSNTGVRFVSGHLDIYLLKSGSKELISNISPNNSNRFSSENMVLVASINPDNSIPGNDVPDFSFPSLEVTLLPQNSQKSTASSSNKNSFQFIPRPPALVGLQGSISHDAKSRRSLEAEMDSSTHYMKKCLDRAQVTINLILPIAFISLNQEKISLLKNYMETLSLWLNKQQQLQSQSLSLDSSDKLNDKILSVLSASLSEIVITIENNLKHEIHLNSTTAFVIAGLVEDEKTYCHLHSQNLDIHSINKNFEVLQIISSTACKRSIVNIKLPQLSFDYLMTPKVEDLNELVIRVDWSTLDLEHIDIIKNDLVDFFSPGNHEISQPPANHTDFKSTPKSNANKKLQDSDSLYYISSPSNSPNPTDQLETSPLQLYLFIRNISFRCAIGSENINLPINKSCPKSIVLAIESIIFINLFSPENSISSADNDTYKFITSGIQLFGEPSFASEMAKSLTPFPNTSLDNNSSNALVNLEKFWSNQGLISLLHIVTIDFCIKQKLGVVECETIKIDVNRDTVKTIKLVSDFLSAKFSNSNDNSSKNNYTIFNFSSNASNDVDVFNEVDIHAFKPKNSIESINNTFSKVSLNKPAHNLSSSIYSNEISQMGNSNMTSTTSVYNAPSIDGEYLEPEYENVSASEAQGSMLEFRKKASEYRSHGLELSGFQNLDFNYLDGNDSHRSNSGKKAIAPRNNPHSHSHISNNEPSNPSSSKIGVKINTRNNCANKINEDKQDVKTFSYVDDSSIDWIEDYIGESGESSINGSNSEKSNANENVVSDDPSHVKRELKFKLNLAIGKIQVLLFDSNSWSTDDGPIKLNFNQKPQIELELKNKRLQFVVYEDSSDIKWDLVTNLSQINIYDLIENSQWSKFLTRMQGSEYKNYGIHPTLFHSESNQVTNIPNIEWIKSSKYTDPILPDILKVRIEAVRVKNSCNTFSGQNLQSNSEAIEYRLDLGISPIRSYIDQDALVFLIGFFSNNENKPLNNAEKNLYSPTDTKNNIEHLKTKKRSLNDSKNSPYFQAVSISQIILKFDYKPKLYPLASKDLLPDSLNKLPLVVEILNLIAIEEASLSLRPIQLRGISGFDGLVAKAMQIWLPHVRESQIPGVVGSITPLKPLSNLGTAMVDMVVLPISEYKKNGKWYKGFQKGLNALAKVSAVETMNISTKLAINAQNIFEQAGEILNVPTSNSQYTNGGFSESDAIGKDGSSSNKSKYASQPRNVTEGVKQAYHGMARNFGQVAQTILAIPIQVSEGGGDDSVHFGYVDSKTGNDEENDHLPIESYPNQGNFIDDSDFEEYGASQQEREDSDDQFVFLDYSNSKTRKRGSNSLGVTTSVSSSGGGISGKQRARVNSSVKNVVRAVPVAILNPIIGASEAVSKTLLGIRNSLDKNRNEKLQDKYKVRSKR
ncbi:Autophagy-related protein 2 [Smittium culicis]|uniref:Autophagy-related protein 2 n=1 Tax=Smittium culicis TaxID=133412 RepID=A0A1R1YQI3_9FUNG|nr:Autophagy-related protein 2 [Smittium culicis]